MKRTTYRNSLKARIPEGVYEQFLPQRVRILEVHYRLVTAVMMDALGCMLYGERRSPYAIVAVAVEARPLTAAPRGVLHFVLIRRLRTDK